MRKSRTRLLAFLLSFLLLLVRLPPPWQKRRRPVAFAVHRRLRRRMERDHPTVSSRLSGVQPDDRH
jgi:hypothetical protein